MKIDLHIPIVGVTGIFASLTLERLNLYLAIAAAGATFVYMTTQWFLLYRKNREILTHPWRR